VASIPRSFNALIASGDDFLTVSATAMRPAISLSMESIITNMILIFLSVKSESRTFGSLDYETLCMRSRKYRTIR